MRLAIINLTGGGMSGGYKKYLSEILPRMEKHKNLEAILCATPNSIGVQDWFDPFTNIEFIRCRPFNYFKRNSDSELFRNLELFSPDIILIPDPTVYLFHFSGLFSAAKGIILLSNL